MCVDKENRLSKKTVVICPALLSIDRLNLISAGFMDRPASENLLCLTTACLFIKYCIPSQS